MFSLLTTTDRYSCDLWSFYIVLTVLPKPAEMNQRITEASRKWANLWCRDLGEFLYGCERTDRMIGSLHLEKHDTGFNVEAFRWSFFSWAVFDDGLPCSPVARRRYRSSEQTEWQTWHSLPVSGRCVLDTTPISVICPSPVQAIKKADQWKECTTIRKILFFLIS